MPTYQEALRILDQHTVSGAEVEMVRDALVEMKREQNRYVHATRCAYGLLWQDLSGSPLANDARQLLHDVLPEQERSCGIQYAQTKNGHVTEADIVAAQNPKPRTGVQILHAYAEAARSGVNAAQAAQRMREVAEEIRAERETEQQEPKS